MSGALLEVRALTIAVGARTLVRDLSLSVHAGEVWSILGANGAGKTMFLKTLVGLRGAQGGAIRLAGQPLERWSPGEAARWRGYLPQIFHDAFSATLLEAVMIGRHPHLSRWAWEGARERRAAIAALHTVGLASMADRDITTLSGGERQRAAIAALLVQEAPLLILDEPVAHLDLHHQLSIAQHLCALAREHGKAVIFSVHDLNLASRFATHAMLYRDNGSVDSGPIGEVMNDAALSHAFRCGVAQVKFGERTVFVTH